jgi:metal-responsive CopG/Arc/MetJ family transcriptional regulator
MSPRRQTRTKVLLSIRQEYIAALDKISAEGAASSRSDLIERMIAAFLADLKQHRTQQGALGNLVGFLVMLLGASTIKQILGGDAE